MKLNKYLKYLNEWGRYWYRKKRKEPGFEIILTASEIDDKNQVKTKHNNFKDAKDLLLLLNI